MTKKQFAERVSEETGLSIEKCQKLLELMEEGDVFIEKDKTLRSRMIAERLELPEKEAENARRGMMKVIKCEVIVKSALIAFAVTAAIVIFRFRRKKNVSENS